VQNTRKDIKIKRRKPAGGLGDVGKEKKPSGKNDVREPSRSFRKPAKARRKKQRKTGWRMEEGDWKKRLLPKGGVPGKDVGKNTEKDLHWHKKNSTETGYQVFKITGAEGRRGKAKKSRHRYRGIQARSEAL